MYHSRLFLAISLAVSGLFLISCDNKNNEAAANQQQLPNPTVDVMRVQLQTVPLIQEFAGRTVAYEKAEVRPQVTGFVDDILYRQGSMVTKEQPLYKLSIDNYRSAQAANTAAVQQAHANVNTAKASYNNALANLASHQAQLEQAQTDVKRLEPLVEIKAISQQQYDQAVTNFKTAQAAYASAQASVEQARANIASSKAAVETAKAQLSGSELDISRTTVRAPISGITDRSEVTVGALVNANQPNPLVTISKINPIYIDISQSSSDLLKLKQQQASGALKPGSSSVELILEDGSTYPVRGQLSLAEAKADENSGSVTLRAVFNNDNYTLIPGMFVTAKLTQGLISNAVLVPQSAVNRTPKGDTQVLIVDENNKIQIRPVTINGTYEGKWIVTDGLKNGENLVIIGGSKVKPEQEVTTKPYTPTSSNGATNLTKGGQSQGPVAPSSNKSNAPEAPKPSANPEKPETSKKVGPSSKEQPRNSDSES